ncbi:hypothetical protein KQI84_12720 [bacterium]|nr:hypothetical protein [bacterium]
MKNALWSVLLINLIAVGIAFGYVALEPQKVRDVFSGKTQTVDFRAMAEQQAKLPARRTTQPQTPTRRPTTKEVAEATPKAPERRPPARRPPTRSEIQETNTEPEKPIDRAEYVGPALDPITEEPPAPELYPFRVDRRTFPTEDTVKIEMSVQNQSGYHWQTAYVVLKSTDFDVAEVFRIDEWAIEEVVGIDYVFPRADYTRRLKNLRIIRVSGTRRESALAETIGAKRQEIVKELGTKEHLVEAQDPLKPTGLLSVWVEGTSLVQGTRPSTGSSSGYSAAGAVNSLRIKIPEDAIIKAEDAYSVPPTSPDRRKGLELLDQIHKSAYTTQSSIRDLTELLNQKSVRAVRTDEGAALVTAASEAMRQFNDAGIELTLLASRSDDEAVKEMARRLNRMAEQLVTQADAVESKVRMVEPDFTIMSED